MTVNATSEPAARPRIYELDLLRPLTALTVVAVHVLAFTPGLYATMAGTIVHLGVLATIHWTRYVFLFITAFALTYVYYRRPFTARRFWIKRGLGFLLPYAVWSSAYTWANNPAHQPLAFARAAAVDMLTGSASYQLYYILLTVQFYLVFPWFVRVLPRIARHPWPALGVSFALELVFMDVSYHYVQQGPLLSSSFGQLLDGVQNGLLPAYQFYVILGGLGAVYLHQGRAFLLRHGPWVVSAFALALAAALGHYALQVEVYHTSLDLVGTVFHPMTVIYSLAVIVVLCWLSCCWARRTGRDGRPPGYRFWRLLSDASFGIYLVHAFILTAVLTWLLPLLPAGWLAGLRVFLVWALTAGGAALISIVLLRIPVLSRLVGRSAAWRTPTRVAVLPQWVGNRLSREGNVDSR